MNLMSETWHWVVIVITAVNILACWWLIRWSSAQGDSSKGDNDTLDHVWDENLKERNQPLPRWWLILFYGTIIWGFGYLVAYPGMGNFAGTLGWSQEGQWQAEVDAVDDIYAEKYARLAALDWDDLVASDEAMLTASRLFAANCTTCHGSDGGGAVGFPSLRDSEWNWGSDFNAIQASITNGRVGVMPPWGPALGGDEGVAQMVQYVLSLSGSDHDPTLAAAGQAKWTMCLACHGPDGKGNQALGAPDLTNNIWQYGGSEADLAHSIAIGRKGEMPAHKDLLSPEKIKLLSAYVVSLGKSDGS